MKTKTRQNQDPELLPVKKSFIKRWLPDEKPVGIFVVIAILLAGLIVGLAYKPKPKSALKTVSLYGVSIVNKDRQHAANQLSAATAAQKINVTINGKTYTYSDSDLGIRRDTSSLLDAAYAPPDSIINKKLVKQQPAKLNTYIQKEKLIAAIDSKLGKDKTTVDATVSVNGGTLTVNPSNSGLNIDYDQLVSQLEQSNLQPVIKINANFKEQQPSIPTSAATTAKNDALALINKDYGVSMGGTNVRYASLAQKASWLTFTPDPVNHILTATINIIAAQKTMASVASQFNQSSKNRITITGTDGTIATLEEGQPAVVIGQSGLDTGLKQLGDAIAKAKPLTFSVQSTAQAQNTRNLGTSTGGKFVLVDVADYRAYAINDTTVDRTMIVSTGRPGMETPKGHYNILRKVKLVTMSGCNKLAGCWTVPNVPNAEYFRTDGDALHGTYWHVNWGHQNASHGCVNLQLADAAWLYDWTIVGTDVIVV